MAQTKPIPFIPFNEVSQENFGELYDDILNKISHAKYIALDTEFTGHCRGLDIHMEKRYENLTNVVRSHAVVSFGLTTVEQLTDGHFSTRNFEFLTSNQETFSVNPSNLKFLAENGLDFSRHFSVGIPYRSGGNVDDLKIGEEPVDLIRKFWHNVLRHLQKHKIPIIVHNGFLDLMYIYQSFVCNLPQKFHTFVADLLEIFPGGIYDTKHLVSQALGEEKHWLAYLYCKFDRIKRQRLGDSPMVQAQEPIVASDTAKYFEDTGEKRIFDIASESTGESVLSRSQKRRKRQKNQLVSAKPNAGIICFEYAHHGFCKKAKQCQRSHDLGLILDHDLGELPENDSISETKEIQTLSPKSIESEETGIYRKVDNQAKDANQRRDHSAHFDAYMTAYVFCYSKTELGDEELKKHINKVYLMRHRHPLNIIKSQYTRSSSNWAAVKKIIWPDAIVP